MLEVRGAQEVQIAGEWQHDPSSYSAKSADRPRGGGRNNRDRGWRGRPR